MRAPLPTRCRPPRRSGFTLTEIMIAATIGVFVLIGVLTTYLMLGRSGANLASYTVMDTQTRKLLEDFAQDMRMASNVTWNSSSSVTLTVVDNYTTTANQVTYAWDNTTGSANFHNFYRMPGGPSSTSAKTIYVNNVTSATFSRYDRLNAAATADASTKRLQLTLTIATTNRTVTTATDATISATFVLRNKLAS